MAAANGKSCGVAIGLAGVAKRFATRPVLSNITLDIRAGEFVALVGRSGCGKSTLLRVLCGLEQPSGGVVRVSDAAGQDRRGSVRVVFQEPRLLPWKSVVANVCIGKDAKGADAKRTLREAALRVLHSVGLQDRANEYPAVLSGGQRQRVALARALLHEPSALLLDEPFGALDALTRIEAQRLVESLWLERRFTALLVTHDVAEAVLLADRVFLVEEGTIAASFEVPVPRPRRRDDIAVSRIAGKVLDRIFASPEAGRTLRPSESRETSVPELTEPQAKPVHA